MKTIALIFVAFFTLSAEAKKLICEIKLNTEKVLDTKIQTQVSEKVSIGRTHGISAYITEKPDASFLLEAYLEVEDVRIYAQGILKNPGESVTASLWSRESLVDISCLNP